MSNNKALATVAGGCFWCIETAFNELQGVSQALSGYAGGAIPNPTYQSVCSGMTGHAEVVQITYDPQVISYKEILHVFFSLHDPTTLNRQGADEGTQYRSAIFYHDEEQRRIAQELIKELNEAEIWKAPIVTTLEPMERFYVAEDYHQNYYKQNSYQPYCMFTIAPKMKKFREAFKNRIKK